MPGWGIAPYPLLCAVYAVLRGWDRWGGSIPVRAVFGAVGVNSGSYAAYEG